MKTYVQHVCKNSKLKPKDYCNNGWIDEDLYFAKTQPPKWKYCDKCVIKGFKNKKRIKRVVTDEEKQKFVERMKRHRELKNK